MLKDRQSNTEMATQGLQDTLAALNFDSRAASSGGTTPADGGVPPVKRLRRCRCWVLQCRRARTRARRRVRRVSLA